MAFLYPLLFPLPENGLNNKDEKWGIADGMWLIAHSLRRIVDGKLSSEFRVRSSEKIVLSVE